MKENIFEQKRKNHMELGEIYFWTATINNWQHLLNKEVFKNVIISSLKFLCEKEKIDIFAFTIMPNHVHFIWRINELNGKEMPQSSFLKYTAHLCAVAYEFKKLLIAEGTNELKKYEVDAINKKHEFWQRDSLAVHLYTADVAYQKLDYLHYNPCVERWQLVNDPCDYLYSSAKFYMEGIKNYSFLKDLRYEF